MGNPAEMYESYMVPVLFRPWAGRLIGLAQPQRGERVLDLACGTGIVARTVAPLVGERGQVVGLDFSPHMLEVAQAAAQREGLSIEWHEGRAEELPFPSGSFDLVLCQFAAMFFADRRAALSEMHRVLKDGGRFALAVFQGMERHPFYQVLDAAIQRRLGLSGVEDMFALADTGALRGLLSDAGFQQVEIEPVSMTARFPNPDVFLDGEIAVDTAAIPAMQHLDDQGRQAVTAAIREEMEQPLREVTEGDHVVLPFHVYIARGRR